MHRLFRWLLWCFQHFCFGAWQMWSPWAVVVWKRDVWRSFNISELQNRSKFVFCVSSIIFSTLKLEFPSHKHMHTSVVMCCFYRSVFCRGLLWLLWFLSHRKLLCCQSRSGWSSLLVLMLCSFQISLLSASAWFSILSSVYPVWLWASFS